MSTSTGLVDRCQAPGLQEGHHGTSLNAFGFGTELAPDLAGGSGSTTVTEVSRSTASSASGWSRRTEGWRWPGRATLSRSGRSPARSRPARTWPAARNRRCPGRSHGRLPASTRRGSAGRTRSRWRSCARTSRASSSTTSPPAASNAARAASASASSPWTTTPARCSASRVSARRPPGAGDRRLSTTRSCAGGKCRSSRQTKGDLAPSVRFIYC